jgi:putative peptidoglycan lipid II flippase
VIASGVAVAANLALNLTLVRVNGYRGLALGTAISAVLNALLLLWLLRSRLGGIDGARLTRAFAGISAASAVMGAGVWMVEQWLERALPGSSTVVKIVRVSASIATGVALLAAMARLLRIAEFEEALRKVTSRAFARHE